MKTKPSLWIAVIAVCCTLAAPVVLPAQNNSKQHHPHQYHHYQLNDVGTFGGPQSSQMLANLAVGVLNSAGAFAGWADTSAIDPLCFFDYPDCYAAHAFVWQNGAKTDLGLLPGGTNSQVNWISANGLMTGGADNGQFDPLLGIPQLRGTFWARDGSITEVGALPGTYSSNPIAVNNRGEVVGDAMNTIPDSNSMLGIGYQTRAFYWKDGMMQDLGTLGTGTDALAGLINERGQVAGVSYTNAIPSAFCAGFGYPLLTTGSFIWDKKNGMKDLGGFGGTCTLATGLNNRGQVVGGSALTGDSVFHPFVWDAATGITDLMGASNGFFGYAQAINDRGQIVGQACDAVTCYAALWRKSGGKWQETDLGIFVITGGCPIPRSVNASAQVVGTDYCAGLPFLSEDGAAIVDLNTLITSNSGLQLNEAGEINDRGEITVNGYDVNGNNHSVVLIPCDENHPDVSGCDYDMIDADTAAARVMQSPMQTPAVPPASRMPGVRNGFRLPRRPAAGFGTVPAHAVTSAHPGSANANWLDDRALSPNYVIPKSPYCQINNGVLTGACVASAFNGGTYSCKTTYGECFVGQPATSLGSVQCANGTGAAVSTVKCSGVNNDFLVSASALTPSVVSPGGSSTSVVDVSADPGYSGSVALTCSVSPTALLAPACSVNPSSVAPGTPSTLNVTTTGPSGALRTADSGLRYALWLPLFGLVATGVSFGSKQKKRKAKVVSAALICMLSAGLVFQMACGGSSSMGKPGTPAGDYTITLTGTGSANLVHVTTMTVTVQ